MNEIFKGVRPLDYLLAALFAVAGGALMLVNVMSPAGDMTDLVAPIESHSIWLIPTFAVALLPILWRRRNLAAVIGASVLLMGAHDLFFGSVVRCGVGLPFSLALAYAVARLAPKSRMLPLVLGVVVLQVLVFFDDSAAGIEAMPFALGLGVIAFGIGLLVRRISGRIADRRFVPVAERAYV